MASTDPTSPAGSGHFNSTPSGRSLTALELDSLGAALFAAAVWTRFFYIEALIPGTSPARGRRLSGRDPGRHALRPERYHRGSVLSLGAQRLLVPGRRASSLETRGRARGNQAVTFELFLRRIAALAEVNPEKGWNVQFPDNRDLGKWTCGPKSLLRDTDYSSSELWRTEQRSRG